MIESAPVGLGIALAPWSGRVRQAPWGKQAPSQAPRRKVLSLGLAHYREAPAGEEKKAEFPQRQRHPAHPTSGPLSGHLPGDPPPQLSLQGQGLPEARGRGLPLPPPRQWGGEEEPQIKFVWAPHWGAIPWILPVGGLWLRGPRAQQRGRAKGAPGGALQRGHWAGVQGRQAPGHCWRPPGSPGGQDGCGGEGFGGVCSSSGGRRLDRPLPAPQKLLQLLRLGPPQVGQGAAALEGRQEGLQALLPQQQLLHLLLRWEGRQFQRSPTRNPPPPRISSGDEQPTAGRGAPEF